MKMIGERDSFFSDYLSYVRELESPVVFHIWSAIGGVAALLGRRVWLDRGYFKLYPNLYILLVSPSGVGRKSTAIQVMMDLLDESGVPLNVLRGKITPAKLIARLASAIASSPSGEAELFIFSREFKVFSKGVMKESSLIEDLTDLYDCKTFDYETKHEGTFQIKKPCINILGASTPEWLGGAKGAEDLLSGGFGARLVPVAIAKHDKKEPWPTPGTLEMKSKERLIERIQRIYELSGEFYVTGEAREEFSNWYKNSDSEVSSDERLKGYYAKKHDLVLKIAMVLAVCRAEELTITKSDIHYALALLAEIEKGMDYAYRGMTSGEKPLNVERIYGKLKEKGEVSHTDLVVAFRYCMTAKDVKEAIDSLIDGDLVEKVVVATSTKPKSIYRLKEKGDAEVDMVLRALS